MLRLQSLRAARRRGASRRKPGGHDGKGGKPKGGGTEEAPCSGGEPASRLGGEGFGAAGSTGARGEIWVLNASVLSSPFLLQAPLPPGSPASPDQSSGDGDPQGGTQQKAGVAGPIAVVAHVLRYSWAVVTPYLHLLRRGNICLYAVKLFSFQ